MGAFAYATLMEWTDLVVSNAEFQLYPVKRYAMGRLAQWTGFALGVVRVLRVPRGRRGD